MPHALGERAVREEVGTQHGARVHVRGAGEAAVRAHRAQAVGGAGAVDRADDRALTAVEAGSAGLRGGRRGGEREDEQR